MSLTGKTTPFITLKRQDVQQQKSTGVGYQNLAFAHQATAGQTGIDLTSLVAPAGFNNPSPSAMLNANVGFYQNNLILVSSVKGMLIPNLSFTTSGAQRISFVGFTAEQDEIFYGAIQANPRTGLMAVDARSIGVTGSLAVGATDFNVGSLFKVNDNSTQQIGQVLVFRNSIQQFRCVGNNILNEGDYVELDLGNGYGQVIRFKLATAAPDDDDIMVVSNGLIAEKPDASQLAEVERVAGQIERLIPYVASAAGVDETDLRQYSPTNLDLKAFGDQVLDHENRLDNYVGENLSAVRQYNLTVTGTGFTSTRAVGIPYKTLDGTWRLRFNIVGTRTSSATWLLSVSGITTVNVRQAIASNDDSGGSAQSNAFAEASSSTIQLTHAAAFTGATCAGDIELTGKPSFVP